jgi:hypothetical protein
MHRLFSMRFLVAAASSASLLLIAQGCALQSSRSPAPSDYVVVDKVKIGGVGGWDFIAFDAVHQRLFISRGDRVQVWNARSKLVEAEIGNTSGVHGIALANDLQLGFTSNGRTNTVMSSDSTI